MMKAVPPTHVGVLYNIPLSTVAATDAIEELTCISPEIVNRNYSFVASRAPVYPPPMLAMMIGTIPANPIPCRNRSLSAR